MLTEIEIYPWLGIEQTLLLTYDRDLAFYVSRNNKDNKVTRLLNAAMTLASESGLIKNLVTEFWGTARQYINFKNRRRLVLSLP